MMEKSTRFVSFSGLSSIVIGIYACIAAIIAYSILGNTTPVPDWMSTRLRNYNFWSVFASLLIIVCIVTVILMCRHKAHQNNQSLLFDFNTKRLLWNFPSAFGCRPEYFVYHWSGKAIMALLLRSCWYSMASLWSVRRIIRFPIPAIWVMRKSLSAWPDSFVENYALLFWVVGFGLFHIVYGIFFHLKYEKKNKWN